MSGSDPGSGSGSRGGTGSGRGTDGGILPAGDEIHTADVTFLERIAFGCITSRLSS